MGMASGLSAIFRSPIGTALFAVEVLYGRMEFEAGALLYTMLSSVVAYVLNGLFVGWQPLFRVPSDLGAPAVQDYLWYVVLGLVSGPVATLLPVFFYRARDAFRKIPLAPHLKPAVGGLGVGLMALWLPQILGGGYGWIQEAIDGRLAVRLLLILVFAKILALALTVSSGGSGGVFAPALYVGAMLGALVAQVTSHSPAAFAVVGMAAVFAGAARVPMASLLMVTEMTGGYQLLVPAALAVFVSYFVQERLSERLKYRSLYEAQVPARPDSPTHQVEQLQNAMEHIKQGRVPASRTIGRLELAALIDSGVEVDLVGGLELALARLKPGCPWIGRPIQRQKLRESDGQVVAILRDSEVLVPQADTTLQADDLLLLVVEAESWPKMQEYLEPVHRSGQRPAPA
jgi:CIC family chloride channel protein